MFYFIFPNNTNRFQVVLPLDSPKFTGEYLWPQSRLRSFYLGELVLLVLLFFFSLWFFNFSSYYCWIHSQSFWFFILCILCYFIFGVFFWIAFVIYAYPYCEIYNFSLLSFTSFSDRPYSITFHFDLLYCDLRFSRSGGKFKIMFLFYEQLPLYIKIICSCFFPILWLFYTFSQILSSFEGAAYGNDKQGYNFGWRFWNSKFWWISLGRLFGYLFASSFGLIMGFIYYLSHELDFIGNYFPCKKYLEASKTSFRYNPYAEPAIWGYNYTKDPFHFDYFKLYYLDKFQDNHFGSDFPKEGIPPFSWIKIFNIWLPYRITFFSFLFFDVDMEFPGGRDRRGIFAPYEFKRSFFGYFMFANLIFFCFLFIPFGLYSFLFYPFPILLSRFWGWGFILYFIIFILCCRYFHPYTLRSFQQYFIPILRRRPYLFIRYILPFWLILNLYFIRISLVFVLLTLLHSLNWIFVFVLLVSFRLFIYFLCFAKIFYVMNPKTGKPFLGPFTEDVYRNFVSVSYSTSYGNLTMASYSEHFKNNDECWNASLQFGGIPKCWFSLTYLSTEIRSYFHAYFFSFSNVYNYLYPHKKLIEFNKFNEPLYDINRDKKGYGFNIYDYLIPYKFFTLKWRPRKQINPNLTRWYNRQSLVVPLDEATSEDMALLESLSVKVYNICIPCNLGGFVLETKEVWVPSPIALYCFLTEVLLPGMEDFASDGYFFDKENYNFMWCLIKEDCVNHHPSSLLYAPVTSFQSLNKLNAER